MHPVVAFTDPAQQAHLGGIIQDRDPLLAPQPGDELRRILPLADGLKHISIHKALEDGQRPEPLAQRRLEAFQPVGQRGRERALAALRRIVPRKLHFTRLDRPEERLRGHPLELWQDHLDGERVAPEILEQLVVLGELAEFSGLQPGPAQDAHCQLLRFQQPQPSEFNWPIELPQPRLLPAAGDEHPGLPTPQVAEEPAQLVLLGLRPGGRRARREAGHRLEVVPDQEARHLLQQRGRHLPSPAGIQQLPLHTQLLLDERLEQLADPVADLHERQVLLKAEEEDRALQPAGLGQPAGEGHRGLRLAHPRHPPQEHDRLRLKGSLEFQERRVPSPFRLGLERIP